MQPLPYIELIGFLDWIDQNGYAHKKGITVEEMFLDRASGMDCYSLANSYLNSSKKYPQTRVGVFEKELDTVLSEIKNICMSYFKNRYSFLSSMRIDDVFRENMQSIENIIWRHGSSDYEYKQPITPETLVKSIRDILEYMDNSELEDYLLHSKGSATNLISGFTSYLKQKEDNQMSIINIPIRILKKYIAGYLEEEYRRDHINRMDLEYNRQVLERVFFGEKYTDYFNRLTNIESVAERYWNRNVRCKCLFFADNMKFYDLVEEHWQELNDYSGKYLDIFYNPEELTCKGYKTADKLHIRERISMYPAIYLWKTTLDSGQCISVADLSIEDLLLLIKYIVDLISSEKSLSEIVDSANVKIKTLQEITRAPIVLEEEFVKNLLSAGITLQGNPEVYGDATEDERNTQIRDLLRIMYRNASIFGGYEYRINIEDQTRIGWSATGKRAGELDLFIKLNHLPYAILEGIIIEAEKEGKHWNRTNLMEHIRRIGNYDQNGLKRNVLIVYAETDHFSNFCDNLYNAIETSPKSTIRNSKVQNLHVITADYTENSNISIARAEYDYNAQVRTLYIFVIGFDNNVANVKE